MGQSSPDRPPFTLAAVKAFHTAIWFTIEFAVPYLLYTGVRRKKGPAVTVAASVVALESAVYLGNGQGARSPRWPSRWETSTDR